MKGTKWTVTTTAKRGLREAEDSAVAVYRAAESERGKETQQVTATKESKIAARARARLGVFSVW